MKIYRSERKSTIVTNPFSVLVAIGALLVISTPAQARFDYTNWQPQLGPIHGTEDALEARMNIDYSKGYIDSNELALMRRDMDGIQAQEDEFRMDHNGLGVHDRKCLANKLRRFELNLERAEGDKFCQTIAVK